MFNLLKKKLTKAIESISEKFEKKEVKPEVTVEKPKKGFIERIFKKVVKKVAEKKISEKDLEPILNELENGLIEADVAYEVAEKIKNDLRKNLVDKEVKRGKEKEVVIDVLRKSLLEILSIPKLNLEEVIEKAKKEKRPAVLIFLGMNGVGKSLSLSKVAKWLKDKGHIPILAAGDTYRAAGIPQLEKYAEMIKVPVIKQKYGSDSCAVIFDTRKAAEARGNDVVLADTSGRMHTDKDLLNELAKIVRVNKPDLKILILDSLSGSDVLNQFELFDKAVNVDAVIFSKVDVNEKGGNIFSICYSFKKPILFLGNGQMADSLEAYNPERIVNSLIG